MKMMIKPKSRYIILLICIIVILISLLIYFNHVDIYNAYYQYKLKMNFDSLKSLNIGWRLVNYNIYGYNGKDKIILHKYLYTKKATEFTNKNAIGAILNNIVLFDIDSREPDKLTIRGKNILDMLPKTVMSKTAKGYHYYFINDTGKFINNYIHLNVDGKEYPIDLFTNNQLTILPPTEIEDKNYQWIHSPFTTAFHKISDNQWIVDLFKNTEIHDKKLRAKKEQIEHMRFSSVLSNVLFVSQNYYITKKIKNSMEDHLDGLYKSKFGYLYKNTTTGNFHLFLKNNHSISKYSIQHMVNELTKIIQHNNILGIVNLSLCTSNQPQRFQIGDIVQFNSCIMNDLSSAYLGLGHDYIYGKKMLVKTDKYVKDPLFIYTNKTNQLNPSLILTNNEKYHFHCSTLDPILTFITANKLNLPSLCICGVCNYTDLTDYNDKDSSDTSKKLIQYATEL